MQHSSQQIPSWQLVSYEKNPHHCQVTALHVPKFLGKVSVILCCFMPSFSVPSRMSWGFPSPQDLSITLWKFFTSPKQLVYWEVWMWLPLCLSVFLQGFRSLHSSYFPHIGSLPLSPENKSETQRKAGSSTVYPGPGHLQSRKGSMTPGSIFTAASQLRTVRANPAHPRRSPSFPLLLQCIFSQHCSILFPRAWWKLLDLKYMKKTQRLFRNKSKGAGGECPDEGRDRLGKFRVAVMEQLDKNRIVRVKYRHHRRQTSFLSLCIIGSLSTKPHLKICGNLQYKPSAFHALHLLFSVVKSACRKKYIS